MKVRCNRPSCNCLGFIQKSYLNPFLFHGLAKLWRFPRWSLSSEVLIFFIHFFFSLFNVTDLATTVYSCWEILVENDIRDDLKLSWIFWNVEKKRHLNVKLCSINGFSVKIKMVVELLRKLFNFFQAWLAWWRWKYLRSYHRKGILQRHWTRLIYYPKKHRVRNY